MEKGDANARGCVAITHHHLPVLGHPSLSMSED